MERKAFSDLVSSLSSGRLQKQMEQMTRMYRTSLLLIEMDGSQRGLFKATGEATLTATRLIVLLRSYPTMRLLWSFSDRCSCNVSSYLQLCFYTQYCVNYNMMDRFSNKSNKVIQNLFWRRQWHMKILPI